MEEKSRYLVLYTQAGSMGRIAKALSEQLPSEKGFVFTPCAELWMRGARYEREGHIAIRPLFPGYLFIRTSLSRQEIHGIVRKAGRSAGRLLKELSREEPGNEEGIADLTADEAAFLDHILELHTDGGPEDGVIRMSQGYMENGRIVVMEGPLAGHEDEITDIRKRDRKVYLRLTIGGHTAKAGLILHGKRHYFPEDKDAPYLLEDGTEVDTRKIAKRMMRNQ